MVEALPDAPEGDRALVAARLCQLLGIDPGAEGSSSASDPSGRRRSEDLLSAVAVVLEGLPSTAPTFVLLEDVHWADAILLDGLDRAAARDATAPVLLGGNGEERPGRASPGLRDWLARPAAGGAARRGRRRPAAVLGSVANTVGHPAPSDVLVVHTTP